MKRPLRVAVLRLVAGQVPDDQGLVTAAGEEHVRAKRLVSKIIFAVRRVRQRSYFSIEVARLVTQPFYIKKIHVSQGSW